MRSQTELSARNLPEDLLAHTFLLQGLSREMIEQKLGPPEQCVDRRVDDGRLTDVPVPRTACGQYTFHPTGEAGWHLWIWYDKRSTCTATRWLPDM